MNNDLKIKMKIISNENISMKLEDSKPINMAVSSTGKEVDPIFRNSPAYTITYNDITYWNNKSNFSGNYNDLTNKPIIPSKTSQLVNDIGFVTKNVNNLENYTLSSSLSTVATSGLYSDLLEKPTIPSDTSDLTNNAGFVTASVNNLENYTLTSNLATVATTGSYSDLLNTPTLANVATTGQYSDLLNKPTLSTVASTGDYDDLIDKPDLSNYITKDVNDLTYYTLTSSLSSVATSGDYGDLLNKPTIPILDNSVSTSSTNGVENQAITNYVNTYISDTGWVDLSSYVNTSNFSARSGFKPMARRIGKTVYLKGAVYCSTAPNSNKGNILTNIPSQFRPPEEIAGAGARYGTTTPFRIWYENGNISVQEANNIPTTQDYQGYALSSLGCYLVD